MVVKEKAKYKETEIGMIPEDWDLVDFDNAFDFLSTATYSRSELVINGDIYYIHYGDIHTKFNHFLDFNQEELCGVDKIKAAKYSLIEDGDLVLADASEDYEGIGKGVEIKNLSGKKAIAGLHTFLLRDKKNLFTKGFKGYFHSNRLIKKQLDRLATGLKVYGISKYSLKTILIPVPPLLEQTSVIEALNDIDQLINSLEKIIIKKLNIKQGAIQELLSGKKRLPGFSKKWEQKNIGEVFSVTAGGDLDINNFSAEYDDNYCYPIYSNALTNKGLYGYTSKYEQNEDTITITARGRVGVANPRRHKYCAIGRVLILSPLQELDIRFIAEYINNFVEFSNESTGVPQLTAPQVLKYEIFFPPKYEQEAIAAVLSDMDQEIESLEKRRKKYIMIKQGMMENLLTGRIRLV